MHLWPSKKVRDFFTVSHLDFIERNGREKHLLKQTSRTRTIDGEVAGEGETPPPTPPKGPGRPFILVVAWISGSDVQMKNEAADAVSPRIFLTFDERETTGHAQCSPI